MGLYNYSRAKGPGTSAGAFPMALSLSREDPRGPRCGAKGSVGPPGPLELAALVVATVRCLRRCARRSRQAAGARREPHRWSPGHLGASCCEPGRCEGQACLQVEQGGYPAFRQRVGRAASLSCILLRLGWAAVLPRAQWLRCAAGQLAQTCSNLLHTKFSTKFSSSSCNKCCLEQFILCSW